MAGSRGTCGSRLPDMHYPQRLRSHTSNGKSSIHVRASKVPAENEGCSSRYDNSYHRSGSRSSSTYINSATDSTKQDYASASSSSSNRSSNSIAFDGRQTSFLPALQNARYGIPRSSDESGSDLDIEVGESLISGIPAVIDPAGWDNLASSSVNKFSGLKSNLMEGDAGVSRRPKSHDVHTLSWRDRYMSQRARAHSSTSRSLFVDQGRPHGLATIGASHKSLWEGSSSKAPHIDDFTAPLSLDKKATLNVDCVCQSEIEGHVPVSGLSLPKNRIVAYSSRRLGQPTASAGDLQSNRKSSTQASYGRRMRPDDLGPGNREVNCIGAGTSRSRHSLSNLVCSSAADVLPPVSSSTLSNLVCSSAADVLPSASSSAVGAADRFCPRKNSRALGRSEEGEASRGMCLVKRQMGNGSVLGLGETFDSQGGQSQDQVFCGPDLEPSRSVRLSPPHLELETRCHRKPVPLEIENVTHNASFSFTGNGSPPTNYGNRSPPTYYRHRGSNPVVQRSGDRRGPSSRSNNPFLEPIAFGEELSNQCSIRRSLYVNQAVGLMGLDNEISNSHRSHSPPFGSTWSAMHEMRPSFSGPPTRPPPLPPSAVFAEPSASESGFPLTTLTTSPHLPHASQSTGSASPNREVEGSSSSIAEAAAFGSSTSTGETRSRLTVEGLSEILSALEYIERDEDLSYEQILMLEATILLGGIGLHDRYGDMRIDVDNMSYEELLALEERIGNVNTGLSEESIMKCMLIDTYASPGINSGYVPKDIEIKCSICQEEFEEAVELGVLECGHSHHIACIKQWLLQKNQCPICKASAVPQGHILHSVKH